MERPDVRGVGSAVLAYIEYLESVCFGASDLIKELNQTSKVFAEDLRKIRSEDGMPIYIGKSDKTKRFEHAMTLFQHIDKIKALALLTVEPAQVNKAKSPIKIGENAFEAVINDVKRRNGAG